MPVNSQVRIPLHKAMQQSAGSPVAALVSQQYPTGGNPFLTNFTVQIDFERFIADATGGDIVATVPLATDLVKGKPYIVEKKGGTNTVTIAFSGDDTFFGESTIVLTGDGDAFAFISDGITIKSAYPSGTPGVAPAGSLAADQDLADLANVVTARTNLGVNKEYIPLRVTTLVGSGVYRTICKYAGTITRTDSITEGVLTSGDATLQAKLNGANIGSTTTGLITITQADSAAGDKDSATPATTNITVAVGDELSLTVGGTNATATAANCWIEITRT